MVGQVICVYKLLPKSPDRLDELKRAIEKLKPQRIEEDPIAFGLKALVATFLVPEKKGRLEEIEKKLNSIKSAQSVENIRISRSL